MSASQVRVRREPRAASPRRRLAGVMIATVVASAIVVGQLVKLQALSADELAARSASQTLRTIELKAQRGSILDRNGLELALSVPQMTVAVNPQLVTDPAGEAAALAEVLDLEVEVLRERLSRSARFVYLARQVPDEVADRVAALDLPGVLLVPEPRRFHPAGGLAAPVLGEVGIDDNGLAGLELTYEDVLSGSPGELVVERAPGGVEIPVGHRRLTEPSPGDDLVLTLDRSIQFEAERLLGQQILETGAEGGLAIVMDPRTGDVLAMASLQRGTPTEEADSVDGDGDGAPVGVIPSPKNKAVTDVFEPGSVNKVITVAAALEEGIHGPDSELTVADSLRVADHTFTDHSPHATEPWSITDILVRSSNVGTIMIAQEMGRDMLDGYLRAFGFGAATGIDFPGEVAGLMLDVDRWSGTTIGTVPIGQGVSVTALQMISAYNVLANGGTWTEPRLVKGIIDRDGRERPVPVGERRQVVSATTARRVAEMLTSVVEVGTGTRASIEGYRVAGKTGTARKPYADRRGYEPGAYIATFAGFVPAEDPQLSIIVMLDEPFPIYGGVVAAPVFADLAAYSLRHLRIPPVADLPAPVDRSAGPVVDGDVNDALVRGEPAEAPATTAPARAATTTTTVGRDHDDGG